ncbi:MAG TPA: ankyrin repeat domain-containing protein [Polyangiaceae bacterium]|nr:ankyrin repeat domain-containing protein [Polyangiaceae bacterium]
MSEALIDFLCRHGFDPANLDAPAQYGLTPVMRAALGGHVDLLAELLARGASVAARNADGNNALWLGCVSNQPQIVRMLWAAGVALDSQNDVGATALMYAASSGKAEIVALLLELGANPYLCNGDGAKAGEMAANVECLRLLRHTIV